MSMRRVRCDAPSKCSPGAGHKISGKQCPAPALRRLGSLAFGGGALNPSPLVPCQRAAGSAPPRKGPSEARAPWREERCGSVAG